jgi:hypothetical protein
MHVVDQTKFAIGILFAVLGIGILVSARRSRGFGQRRQAGALMLVAAIVLVGTGLGYIDVRGMLGR